MKHAIVLLILFLAGWSAEAQQKAMKSDVSSVTVYSDRASITRSASIQLAEGDYEFAFGDLPYSLDNQSLRVEGAGTARARISDIKIETVYIDTLPKNALKILQDQMTALLEEERVITDRITLLTKEKDFLDLIKINVTASSQGSKEAARPSIDDWTRLFTFYDANFEKINSELRNLDKKKTESGKKKSQVQQQINQISGYSKLTRKKAVVNFSVTRAGLMKFDITYVISGARWYPYYDVRVSQEDQKVEFTYYAMISQNTGEDWNNVNLSISTARPNISGSAPQLSAWYLNVYQPRYKYADKEKKNKMSMGAGVRSFAKQESAKEDAFDEVSEGEADTGLLDYETASIEQRSTSVVFTIKKPSTITADNNDHKVTIAIEKLNAAFEYAAVPKIATHVFLTGRIENTTDAPFLAGNMNIFFGNSFVGTSAIETIIPTEKFNVSLGIDDGIKIKREQVRDFKSETGFFSKNEKKSFEYKITVESFKKTDDTIKIRDQFPIPQDERIKVETMLPNFEKKDQTIAAVPNGVVEKLYNNIVEWRLRIRPKEKVELRIKYTVEYSREIRIDGLE